MEEVAFVPLDELTDIQGFSPEIAEELQQRAQQYLANLEAEAIAHYTALGVAPEIAEIEDLSAVMVAKLGDSGVMTMDDLGDLASDELMEILGADALTPDQANAVIMAARASWFEDAPQDEPADAAEADADAVAQR